MSDIIIVDYGMGNLRSVQKKFERINVIAEITEDLIKIKNAKKLVLPGVGHFANGVKKLKENGISFLSEPFEIHTGLAAEFEDPFRNRLGITDYSKQKEK